MVSRGPDVSSHPQQAVLRSSDATAHASRRRPDISNQRLIAASIVLPALLVLYVLALPLMPEALRTPGSPLTYLFGVGGTVLLFVAAVFVLVKRTGRGGAPVVWFMAHVGCGMLGFVLVVVHTTGKLDRPPALLLVNLVALMAIGVWARVRANRAMADTFGTKLGGFRVPDPETRAALASIVAEKTALLERLDPAASEATFSVTLGHLIRQPRAALAYLRLARAEAQLMGARQTVGLGQAWWRPLHLALAAVFVAGVVIHVVMVTFFAGYVADGGPVTWWHVTAWDF
jgi:uncharacterized membrane protein